MEKQQKNVVVAEIILLWSVVMGSCYVGNVLEKLPLKLDLKNIIRGVLL